MKRVLPALLIALGVASSVAAQNRSSEATGAARSGWTTNDDGRQIRVRSSGTFELADDDRDVKSVPPGGYFELSSRNWLSLFGRRYIVRGNEDGTVTRTFSAGASELPIDAAARAWIGDTLQSMIRQGFAAEARVKRILAQQGPSGVLDAASGISNDHGQAIYFRLAAELGRLDPATAARAFRQAGEEIGSDFELARVLVALIQVVPVDEAVVSAVLMSSKSIGSDFEKSRVLRELAERKDLEASSVVGLIRAAASIGSDFEQSRVLRQIVSTQPLDATSRQAMIDTAGRIGSDFERGRVLNALAQGGALR